jgi:hypothetical protein
MADIDARRFQRHPSQCRSNPTRFVVRVHGETFEPGQIGPEFEEAKSNYIRGVACDPKYAAGEIVRHLLWSNAKSRAAHADFGFDMREAEFGQESQARRPFVRGGRLERYLGVPPIDVQQIRQQRGAYALPAELGIDHETAREVAGERSASSTDARPSFPQLNQKA